MAQKCQFCERQAQYSLIMDDGKNHVPVCRSHMQDGRELIRAEGSSVVDIKHVDQRPLVYREHSQLLSQRMESALRPALDFVEEDLGPGELFGLQADPIRAASAFQEAPEAAIGRRDVPVGAVTRTRTGKDIQGVKGRPIKRVSGGQKAKGTSGPVRNITKRDMSREEIPDSLLQMLGKDWKTLRAHRVHDNRMTINVDGVRFSVYTRRG